MIRRFAPDPAPTIAAAIPREPGSKERSMSDAGRTNEVRLAMESYRVTEALFGAVRRAAEGKP